MSPVHEALVEAMARVLRRADHAWLGELQRGLIKPLLEWSELTDLVRDKWRYSARELLQFSVLHDGLALADAEVAYWDLLCQEVGETLVSRKAAAQTLRTAREAYRASRLLGGGHE
jgi:hypothetical protein